MNSSRMRSSAVTLGIVAAILMFSLPSPAGASPLYQDPTPTPSSGAEALYHQAQALYNAGEYEQARGVFEQARAAYRAGGDRMGEADSLKKIAWCYSALRLEEQAFHIYQQELLLRKDLGDTRGIGVVYLNIGASFSRAGDFQQAIEYTQISIPIIEEAGDDEALFVGVMNLVGYLRHEDEYAQVVEAGRMALGLAQKLEDRLSEGKLYHWIGIALRNVERYEEAVEAYDQAIIVWIELSDSDSQAADLHNKARAYFYLSEYVEAADAFLAAAALKDETGDFEGQVEELTWAGAMYLEAFRYELAIDILNQVLSSDYADHDLSMKATTYNDLSICYWGIGEYQNALQSAQDALDLKRSIGEYDEEAASLGNIAAIQSAMGNFAEAVDYYEQALQIERDVGDREEEAQTLDNLGRNYVDMSLHDQAWFYFQQSLDVRRDIGDLEGQIKVLNQLGNLQNALGDFNQALIYLEEADDLSLETHNAWGEMTSKHYLGRVYEQLGDQETAITNYRAALDLSDQVGDRKVKAQILADLGWMYFILGNGEDAHTAYEDALAIVHELGQRGDEAMILRNLGMLEQNVGRLDDAIDHFLEALQIARDDHYRSGEADLLYVIGLYYEEQGDDELAIDYYLASLDVRESIRSGIQLEEFKSALASEDIEVYQRAIQLLLKLGRIEDAFDLSERSRARSFLDKMGNQDLDMPKEIEKDFLEREKQLLKEIAALENNLLNGSDEFVGQRTVSTLEIFKEKLVEKQQEYLDLLAEMRLANPALASLVTVSTIDVNAVQELLDPDVTLVSYYVVEDVLRAFVISKTEFSSIELPGTAEAYQQAVQNFRALGLANLGNTHPKSLIDLYEGLITPLLPELKTTRIGIISHQWLHYVPFAALSDGEHYLGKQFVLFKLPAASTLQFLGSGEVQEQAVPLIFGNPLTDNPDLPSLEHAAQEAGLIAELFGVEALIGDQATEAALQAGVGRSNILHLAAHGSFDSEAPLFSKLWLAPGGEADGRLNVHEVYGLDLNQTDLVVLSACQTHLGELSAGDEIVGLNRAFLYSTPTVVSSLWSVDDEATGMMMQAFYTNLLEGMGKAEALQVAQASVRTDESHPDWAHPYYWAGFVLSGDPGAEGGYLLDVEPESENTMPLPILAWSAVIVLLGFSGLWWWMRKRRAVGGK